MVQVVGGLVEQQHVAAALQYLRQVHAVALAAGEFANQLLLLSALEIETTDIATRGSLVVAHLDEVQATGDFLPHAVLVVQRLGDWST